MSTHPDGEMHKSEGFGLGRLYCRRVSHSGLFQDTGVGPYHADLSSLRRLGVMAVAAPVLEQLTLAVAGFVVFVTGMIAVAAHHETATLSSHCCRNKKPQG